MFVVKRSGELEKSDLNKIHNVLEWAIGDLEGVSLSDIEINAHLHLYDKIHTSDIHRVLIRSAADLISEDSPNYQYVAARLLLQSIRKEVWDSLTPRSLQFMINSNINLGIYDPDILNYYTEEDIKIIDGFIDHDRDYKFAYAGLQQMADKYLINNRKTGHLYETPQLAYIMIAMTLFKDYKENRFDYVKKCYDYVSQFKINLPTPIIAGVRTKLRQYSSCVLVDVDDSIEGISAAQSAVMRYVADRAGIGINFGRIRSINSTVGDINQSQIISTGVIPFLKIFESTIKSTSQNGMRVGSATVNFPIWHYEIESVTVLKNNAGTDDTRVRKLDYVIQISGLFYKRFINDEMMTLFSPNEVRDLYDTFGMPEFDELYVKYEQLAESNGLLHKKVPARKLFELLLKERLETGRIYIMNIDHANQHGSFDDHIVQTNLCVEITHPTTPLKDLHDKDAEIGVCVLSALNLGETEDHEFESVCDVIVRLLDSVITNQDYSVEAAKNFATNRRSLGVGVSNLAYMLAKNKLRYEDPKAAELVDAKAEAIQYYLLKSSCQLAKELGPCAKFNRTKYSRNVFPLDTYNKNVDNIVARKPSQDWETLRKDVEKYGLRHSTVTAIMPVESSSVVQNSTNGIEPPRSLVTVKKSKSGTLRQLVPDVDKYGKYYTLAYEMENNKGYINIVSAFQKWFDMAISTNLYYDYLRYDDHKIPLSAVAHDVLYSYRMGLKTIYYSVTNDGNNDQLEKAGKCEGGACVL